MYGHPIAKKLESWWKDHAGRYDDPEWRAFIDIYGVLIRDKYAELLSEHDNGGRFGMAKAGGCTRAATLKLLGADSEALSGSSRATFFIGHTVEIMALATIQMCAYDLLDVQKPLSIEPMMQSARDASIFLDGKRTLLSVKSSSYKKSGKEWRGTKGSKEAMWVRRGFPELPFQGVRNSQPGYWAQMQAEMQADNYDQALILFVAKDMIKAMEGDPYLGAEGNGSLTFYAELVPFDGEFAVGHLQPAWEEAWENYKQGRVGRGLFIHKTGNYYAQIDPQNKLTTQAATGMGWFICDYCDFREACLNALGPAEAVSTLEEQLLASIEAKRAEATT